MYKPCLFSLLLNENIVDIEKPDGLCSLTFVVDEFSGLFLHPSIFSIKHSRSAYIANGEIGQMVFLMENLFLPSYIYL